ncbi:MAG TPA: cytochrome b [Novimethylophilus sp.]|jgi:cytochrome b561|uniref:cytochrome b n=1 Tax=Novimethylophilus sp. TaxID=2137426 RepID=UPI002F3F6C35
MNHTRYTATAIGLHWLMAMLLIALFAVGIYMHELPLSPWKLHIYSWHKWAGVTTFLLVLARLTWRFAHRPPALPGTMPAAMQLAAHAGHATLYQLMIAIPLSGWLMSSAKGFQTVYFGILPIPDLMGKDKALGDLLQNVHQTLNFLLVAMVIGHAGAALKHHLIDKDDVLARMLPRHFR